MVKFYVFLCDEAWIKYLNMETNSNSSFLYIVLRSWCSMWIFVCVCLSARMSTVDLPAFFSGAHAQLSIAMGLFICIKCSCFNKALFVWSPPHTLMESAPSHSWFTSIVLKSLFPDYDSKAIVWVEGLIRLDLALYSSWGNYLKCGWITEISLSPRPSLFPHV